MRQNATYRFATYASSSAIALLLIAGCSNVPKLPTAESLATSATNAFSALPKPTLDLQLNKIKPPVGSPTEIYTRIARGALSCWLGAYGPIKTTHMFRAAAEPRSKGGRSTITIYEAPKDKNRKIGKRAFAVRIAPSGNTASVSAENVTLSEKLAERFNIDVHRWAANDQGCFAPEDVAQDWTASSGQDKDNGVKAKVKRQKATTKK